MNTDSTKSFVKNRQLILASSSSSRRELLSRLGLPFEVVSPDIDETPKPNELAESLVQRLAIEKAEKVAIGYRHAIIIAADEVAVLNHQICSKPESHDDALQYLQAASGQQVTFFTGYCVLNVATQHLQSGVETYHVHFRELSEDMIERYLAKEQPYHCAGSFKIEGLGIALCERLMGDDITALVGLPLIRLVACLEKAGIMIP